MPNRKSEYVNKTGSHAIIREASNWSDEYPTFQRGDVKLGVGKPGGFYIMATDEFTDDKIERLNVFNADVACYLFATEGKKITTKIKSGARYILKIMKTNFAEDDPCMLKLKAHLESLVK